MTLDVYDFCSDELKATMKISRDRNAEKILNEFKEVVALVLYSYCVAYHYENSCLLCFAIAEGG